MFQESISRFLVTDNGIDSYLYQPLPSADDLLYEREDDLGVPQHSNSLGTHYQGSLVVEGRQPPKRITNNSFKIPLNLFKNVLIIVSAATKDRLQEIQKATTRINMSVFPKLIFLSEKWETKKEVIECWKLKIGQNPKLIGNKTEKQSQEFFSFCERMTEALECRGWKKAIKIYWGENVKKKEKLRYSIKEVERFRKEFEQ